MLERTLESRVGGYAGLLSWPKMMFWRCNAAFGAKLHEMFAYQRNRIIRDRLDRVMLMNYTGERRPAQFRFVFSTFVQLLPLLPPIPTRLVGRDTHLAQLLPLIVPEHLDTTFGHEQKSVVVILPLFVGLANCSELTCGD